MSHRHRSLVGILLLATALATAGCHDAPATDYELSVGGCETAHVHASRTDSTVDLDVTAHACHTITDPAYRVAFAIWKRTPADLRTVRIRTNGPASPTTQLTRADIEQRFGPMPPRPEPTPAENALWLLLPSALVVPPLAAFLVIRAAGRSGLLIVFVRRRN